MFRNWKRVFGVVFSLLLTLSLPLAAQNAALVGTAKDSSGAVIANATVTLTNRDTSVSQTVQSDSAGNYEFPFVKPGNYSLKAEQQGFKTFVQTDLILAVSERLRADATMEVGERLHHGDRRG
jgi:hypothetical protein